MKIRPFRLHTDLIQMLWLLRKEQVFGIPKPHHGAGPGSRLRRALNPARLARFLRTWQAHGRVACVDWCRMVGNVSMQRLDRCTWQISNVVVAPSQRRRGIGLRLMQAAQQALCECGARQAVLRVRSDNVAARNLYAKLGFRRLVGLVEMRGRCPLLPPPPAEHSAVPLTSDDGPAIFDLAAVQHEDWYYPLRRADFVTRWPRRTGEWLGKTLGIASVTRYGVRLDANRLAAAMVLRSNPWLRRHRVVWWARSELYGEHEPTMLAALACLVAHRKGRIRVQVDSDHSAAQAGLAALGLHAVPGLDVMYCDLQQGQD
ncbi:MAG: GNAT family N-acetyltransferase [Caldilineaceae bacterium]|nr:GNAT family N-acetyltransferase [Caldilineaceae bacterium]